MVDESPLLPIDHMPEAEVSLRLAFYLLDHAEGGDTATVSIDGAHVECHGVRVFPIEDFLRQHGWNQIKQEGLRDWRGQYAKDGKALTITTQSGIGDVTARVGNQSIRAECKKGPLRRKTGSPEYPLVREAIGQLMTVEVVGANDVLVVAFPDTEQFRSLRHKWMTRPLITRTGIQIVLVGRDGRVEGLSLSSETSSGTSGKCPFCNLDTGDVLRSNEHALAIQDRFPVASGHTLVVPRIHVLSFFDLPQHVQTGVWQLVAEVRHVLTQRFQPKAFNVGINDGRPAGQTVEHAHIHVIPRYDGDVPDPRGGVRWVIPAKAAYWTETR